MLDAQCVGLRRCRRPPPPYTHRTEAAAPRVVPPGLSSWWPPTPVSLLLDPSCVERAAGFLSLNRFFQEFDLHPSTTMPQIQVSSLSPSFSQIVAALFLVSSLIPSIRCFSSYSEQEGFSKYPDPPL